MVVVRISGVEAIGLDAVIMFVAYHGIGHLIKVDLLCEMTVLSPEYPRKITCASVPGDSEKAYSGDSGTIFSNHQKAIMAARANQQYAREVEIAGLPAPVLLRDNPRARRLILKIDPVSGKAVLTRPPQASIKDAIAFAQTKRAWIAEQLAQVPTTRPFTHGATFPFRGGRLSINHVGGRRPTQIITDPLMNGPQLQVGGAPEHVTRRVMDWLRDEARKALVEKVSLYTEKLGVSYNRVQVRDTRSRWGSCTADGKLSFSWRLVLAPQSVLDYVAAHECTHLVYLNHSREFWATLDSIFPGRIDDENWLRNNGASLFRWGH